MTPLFLFVLPLHPFIRVYPSLSPRTPLTGGHRAGAPAYPYATRPVSRSLYPFDTLVHPFYPFDPLVHSYRPLSRQTRPVSLIVRAGVSLSCLCYRARVVTGRGS